MDLPAIHTVIAPAEREALPVSGLFVAGGTWVFSEPQLDRTVLVDLMALGWRPVTVRSDGVDVAATATLDELAGFDYPAAWPATGLFGEAAQCLLASFKVLGAATIGGNLALAYPAGAMIAAAVALDAEVLVWRADGTADVVAAADFVRGSGRTVLGPGDLIRSLHFPATALASPTALRKAAMADRSRSGALLIGRTAADGSPRLVVTAATHRPVVLGAGTPWASAGSVIADELFVDDVHGAADWRRAVVGVLAAEIADELGWTS
ncbi:FAD binding domain-containing protein [Tsukamurella strandjordii]|uniref:FAD binding domain-containing protein n=1 Tax=Tsukamurella strandjordii TaxID=147577 RepID=A0AA90NR14_9ACTN|nr:FAD binding domain-containing protein [Tsukamurella strandjordii]MDP0399154.1 FAD binding domain-containing protein [Tsukamurella strandjordii]